MLVAIAARATAIAAVAPKDLPEGVEGAFVLASAGFAIVMGVLSVLTLAIWLIGLLARERKKPPPRNDA